MRHALRRLAASPWFTLVAVLSLALGIGANTAMFSIVNAVLLRPLPVERPETLVDVFTSDSDSGVQATSSYQDYLAMRALPVFRDAVAYQVFLAPVEQGGGAPEMVIGELVSANFFDVLGVPPLLGRTFIPGEEDVPGASAVVVLGHSFWQRQFGGDPGVVGLPIRLGGAVYTVVGVAPPEFAGMMRGIVPDAWAPLAMVDRIQGDGNRLENRGSRSLFVRARLAEGVTPERATAAVHALGRRLASEYPATNKDREMSVVPTNDVAILPMVDRVLTPVAALLLAMVGLVLLIACANLAGFLLARAADRRREIAIRLALGASRGQLIRMLLAESVLLAVAGGVAGIAVAWGAVRLLTGFQPPLPVPIRLDIPIDTMVLLFTLGVSIVAGLAFGLVPGLSATRPDLAPSLRDETGSVSGRRHGLLRHGLVAGQVAVSMLLLVSAGLFLRSLMAAQDVDPGFDTGPAAIVRMSLEMIGYEDPAERVFFDRLKSDLLALPGIAAVTFTDRMPVGPEVQTQGMTVDGVDPPPGQDTYAIDMASVDADYFDVLGVPLVAGRTFTPADGEEERTVAIVSEAFVRRFFPDGDALGRTIRQGAGDMAPVRIVGIARDAKVRTLGEARRPFVYWNVRQTGIGALQIVARGSLPPEALADEIRRVARAIEPRLPILESKTMREHLAFMLFPPRMAALLLSVFGGLGLLLAVVGVWGIVSYAVARRTREVGLRMALGATPREAVALLTSSGAKIVGIGAAIGLALAFVAGRLVERFLFGLGAFDPVTFASVPLLLLFIGVLASWLPARRAASVDPMRALRVE